jgi:hypothetical protein
LAQAAEGVREKVVKLPLDNQYRIFGAQDRWFFQPSCAAPRRRLTLGRWADDQYFAEEKPHGHHKQTAGSMSKTDRMVRQITSAGF